MPKKSKSVNTIIEEDKIIIAAFNECVQTIPKLQTLYRDNAKKPTKRGLALNQILKNNTKRTCFLRLFRTSYSFEEITSKEEVFELLRKPPSEEILSNLHEESEGISDAHVAVAYRAFITWLDYFSIAEGSSWVQKDKDILQLKSVDSIPAEERPKAPAISTEKRPNSKKRIREKQELHKEVEDYKEYAEKNAKMHKAMAQESMDPINRYRIFTSSDVVPTIDKSPIYKNSSALMLPIESDDPITFGF